MNSWLDGYLISCTNLNLRTFPFFLMGLEIVYPFKKNKKKALLNINKGWHFDLISVLGNCRVLVSFILGLCFDIALFLL